MWNSSETESSPKTLREQKPNDPAVRRAAGRKEKVSRGHHAWYEGELKRPGALLSSTWPDNFEQAMKRAKQEAAEADRAYFQRYRPELDAHRRQEVAELLRVMVPLVEKWERLQVFDREYLALAKDCGVQVGDGLPDPPVTQLDLDNWKRRCDRILNPPRPSVSYQAPHTNMPPTVETLLASD